MLRAQLILYTYSTLICTIAMIVGIKRAVKDISYNSRYYPEKYVRISNRLRKLFRFEHLSIPKFIDIEIYNAIFVFLMGCVAVSISIFSDNKEIPHLFFLIQVAVTTINAILILLLSWIYKNNT